jgi:hypothetical protein
VTDSTGPLRTLETYYDTAPRASATVTEVGPFTLFVRSDPEAWDYDARPRLGLTAAVTRGQVDAVRARQRDLGVPESIGAPDHAEPAGPYAPPTSRSRSGRSWCCPSPSWRPPARWRCIC